MNNNNVNFLDNQTILLGKNFSVDGFSWKSDCRIQSHIHSDHGLESINRSKGFQSGGIILSEESKDLLIAINNPTSNFSNYYNWKVVPNKISKFQYGKETVELLQNGHILGSMQIRVTTEDGRRIGYSGDFSYPCDVLELDELVIDATSPNEKYIRKYSASDILTALIETIDYEKDGPIIIIGHMGRLQHVMYLLSATFNCPFLTTHKGSIWAKVYNENGLPIKDLQLIKSEEGKQIIKNGNFCIVFIPFTESIEHRSLMNDFQYIHLSDIRNINDELVVKSENGNYLIPFTDHADFHDTLNFIKRSGAKKIYPHVTKKLGGKPNLLAEEINKKLNGVTAEIIDPIPRFFKGEEYY